jgi:predicted membrane protein
MYLELVQLLFSDSNFTFDTDNMNITFRFLIVWFSGHLCFADQIGLTPEEVISKIMANPDVALAFQNPRVQQAIMEVYCN